MLVGVIWMLGLPAQAFLLPLDSSDDHWFITRTRSVQIAATRVNATPVTDPNRLEPGRHVWDVRVELWLRNLANEARTLALGVADDPAYTDATVVYIDGRPVTSVATPVRYDPRYEPVHRPSVRRIEVELPIGQPRVIGLRLRYAATVDELGQSVLTLPTHVLQNLAERVEQAFMEVTLPDRPVGLEATLSGYVFYDDPANMMSWFALQWQPRIPLRIAWLGPWAALLAVAEIERCPAPWEVVRFVTSGRVAELDRLLASHDEATREFCAALPLVVRGYRFRSERLREQFAAIDLSRYLPSQGDRGSLYRANPGFTPEMLTDVERLYRNALLRGMDTRDY